MKNIHVIPTDKPSRLNWSKVRTENEIVYKLVLKKELSKCNDGILSGPRNIYITDNEEIKEENYVYSTSQDYNIQKVSKGLVKSYQEVEHYKKIILTTDQDLIKDGVQAIDDEFLEWFMKNPSCEEVEVKKHVLCEYCGQENCDNLRCRGYKDSPYYEIIIPQEEPKQDTVGKVFYESADKTITVYRQETVEEAAKILYSEVDMINYALYIHETKNNLLSPSEWYEKFKKK